MYTLLYILGGVNNGFFLFTLPGYLPVEESKVISEEKSSNSPESVKDNTESNADGEGKIKSTESGKDEDKSNASGDKDMCPFQDISVCVGDFFDSGVCSNTPMCRYIIVTYTIHLTTKCKNTFVHDNSSVPQEKLCGKK